jgi:hypothetical protein
MRGLGIALGGQNRPRSFKLRQGNRRPPQIGIRDRQVLGLIRRRHVNPGLFTDRALPKPIPDGMEPSVHIEVVPASDLERDPALDVATKVRPARRPIFEAEAVTLATPAEGDTVKLGAPSSISVGLTLAMGGLPKERWLVERGIEVEWRMFGIPRLLHLDNGGIRGLDALGSLSRRPCQCRAAARASAVCRHFRNLAYGAIDR